MGDFNPVSLVLFILVFVPGYLYISIVDYFLVRGKKSQFEKTVQGIIASIIIWIFSWFFLTLLSMIPAIKTQREIVASFIMLIINIESAPIKNPVQVISAGLLLLVLVLVISVVAGIAWGRIRRKDSVDGVFRSFTGRDWHKTIFLRFFTENMHKTIILTTIENKKYMGTLEGASDNPDVQDDAIMLYSPHIVNGNCVTMSATSRNEPCFRSVEMLPCVQLKCALQSSLWQGKKQSTHRISWELL